MIIGDRLRALREEKNLSQGDIEKRTGLLRCYISRVENGHTARSLDTLEKMTCAIEVPLYQLFTVEDRVKKPNIPAETIRVWRCAQTGTTSFGPSQNYFPG